MSRLRYWTSVSAVGVGEGDDYFVSVTAADLDPDQPGALAQVATIIARHGGNITSIDGQQADSDFAVDELLVDFSDEPDVASLREDLAKDGDTILVSQQLTERIRSDRRIPPPCRRTS